MHELPLYMHCYGVCCEDDSVRCGQWGHAVVQTHLPLFRCSLLLCRVTAHKSIMGSTKSRLNACRSAQICGDASVTVFTEAAKAGVARAAFISVHDYKFPGRSVFLVRDKHR